MATIQKLCPICGEQVAKDRRVYCSTVCATKGQQQKLESHDRRRKEAQAIRPKPKCAIPECGKEYDKKGSNQKYCSDECAAKGLLAAIERQRVRRQRTKTDNP